MKTVKVCSIIFSFISLVAYAILIPAACTNLANNFALAIAEIIVYAVGILVNIWMLITLFRGDKCLPAGVFGLLFASLVGGILYLCWDPAQE